MRVFTQHLLVCVFILGQFTVYAHADWQPQAAKSRLKTIIEFMRKHPKGLKGTLENKLSSALEFYEKGNYDEGKKMIVDGIQAAVCSTPGAIEPDQVKPNPNTIKPGDSAQVMMLKMIETAKPGSLKKMASERFRLQRDAIQDGISRQVVKERFLKYKVPPQPAMPVRQASNKVPDELRVEGLDVTPNTYRSSVVKRTDSIYQEDMRKYANDLKFWNANIKPKIDSNFRDIEKKSHLELLGDPSSPTDARKEFNQKIKEYNEYGFEHVMSTLKEAEEVSSKSTTASLTLLSEENLISNMNNYSKIWIDSKSEYSKQHDVMTRFALTTKRFNHQILEDAQSGKLKKLTEYMSQKFPQLHGHSPQSVSEVRDDLVYNKIWDPVKDAAWRALDHTIILAVTVATLGTGTAVAAGALAPMFAAMDAVALAGSAIQMGHNIHEAGTTKSFIEKIQNPEIALQALLYVASMTAGPAARLLKGGDELVQLEKIALQKFGTQGGKVFVRSTKGFAQVISKGDKAHGAFQQAQEMMNAAQSCIQGWTAECLTTLGSALTGTLPAGKKSYSALRENYCAAPKKKKDVAVCVPKNESGEDLLGKQNKGFPSSVEKIINRPGLKKSEIVDIPTSETTVFTSHGKMEPDEARSWLHEVGFEQADRTLRDLGWGPMLLSEHSGHAAYVIKNKIPAPKTHWAYHGTTSANLESIRSKGLNSMQGREANPGLMDRKEGAAFARDYSFALGYAGLTEKGQGGSAVLLRWKTEDAGFLSEISFSKPVDSKKIQYSQDGGKTWQNLAEKK